MEATYIDHSGTDLTVVNAARVSFSKESKTFRDSDKRLVSYLARNNHWTPFGHPSITLRERVPIFVARQRFKHVVGFVYNEVSRRYVDDTPEFYTPDVWRARAENKKQGSDGPLCDGDKLYWKNEVTDETEYLEEFHNHCIGTYQGLLAQGVAPEQARMVLPQSLYTEYYCTGSLAAFARAYKLRSEDHAQLEIQELASHWDRIIRPLFPVSWSALVDPSKDPSN